MAPRTYSRGEPCEECGSTRYITSDDGYTYCQRGHQQTARGTTIAHGEEAGELVIAGRKSRRKDSDAESIASTKSGLSAPRAFEQYLLCLQLVLRKQLQWLIKSQGLPDELEVLVKDLWALRLRKHQSRVSYDSGTETEAQSQLYSSQSEGEASVSDATRRSRSLSQRRRKQKAENAAPSVMDCVSMCYVACLLLREPLTIADLYGWTQSGELLYCRASKEVPMGMRERLPAVYQDMLEPQPLTKPDKLQKHTIEIAKLFSKGFGMVVPPLNHALVLYRWMLALALPVECYAASSRLCWVLDLDFHFIPSAPKSKGMFSLASPEVRLMALLVTATKLLFPSDDLERYSYSATDLSALNIDWLEWVSLQRSPEDHHVLHGNGLEAKDDILQASGEQLDEYLDWIEQNVASEDVREHGKAGKDADFRRVMFRMFAADGGKREAHSHSRDSHQDSNIRSSRPSDRSFAGGEVEDASSNYRPRRESKDAALSDAIQHETRAARDDEDEAGRAANAYRDSQPNADRLSPEVLTSSRAKPSTSTNTPRVTGSLFARRSADGKGTEWGGVSSDASNVHGVRARDINRAGKFYRRFRSADEFRDGLPGSGLSVAKMFHERAAGVVGISLEALLKAVFVVEEMLLRREEAARRQSMV